MADDPKEDFPFFKRIVATPSLPFLLKMIATAEKEIVIVSPWIKYKTLKELVDVKTLEAV